VKLAEITIRPATAEDAEVIHAMLRALAAGLGMADQISSTAEDIRLHGFGERPAFEALIAEQDGEPLGLSLYFSSFSSWNGKRGVYLQDIFVDQRARGTGRITRAGTLRKCVRSCQFTSALTGRM